MLIKCTNQEKIDMFRVFDFSDSCLFEEDNNIKCDDSKSDCHNCYDSNIDWDIIVDETPLEQ